MECEKGAAKTEFGMKNMVANINQKKPISPHFPWSVKKGQSIMEILGPHLFAKLLRIFSFTQYC
jgi:hypothetical protein